MTHSEFKPADKTVGEKSRALFEIWQTLKGERLAPRREEVTLAHTRALTSSLWFIDVVDGGKDYRFRLGGEEIVRFLGGRHTGQLLSELPDNPFFVRMKKTLSHCVAHGKPVSLGPSAATYPGKEHWEVEVVVLPLSEDGRTVSCLMGTLQLWPRGTMTGKSQQ
jgi:hypothetical protein